MGKNQKAKALRKEYKKQVKDYMDSDGLFELFSLIVKPRPRRMPKWLWMWGINIFINVQEDWNYAGATSGKGDKDRSGKT